MPYVRKTTRKPYKKRYTKKRGVSTYKTMARVAKSVLLKNTETRTKTLTEGSELLSVGLYHNLSHKMFNGINLIQTEQLGLADSGPNAGRFGDEVFLRGIAMNIILETPVDRSGIIVKMWILKAHDSYFAGSLPVRDNNTGFFSNIMLDKIDTDKVKVLKQLTFKVGNEQQFARDQTANGWKRTHQTSFHKLWVPLRGKYTYRHDGNTTINGKDYNITAWIAAYDTFGSLISDNILNFKATSTFYYKDNN